jgi:hypothetical protein
MMALLPVYFTTTSTKKRKNIKYSSSEEKQKALQLQKDWNDLMKKYDTKIVRPVKRKAYVPPVVLRRETPHYPSVDTGGNATKPIDHDKVYTGTKMIGVAVMHKSNSVPVFSSDDAKEITKMRRG